MSYSKSLLGKEIFDLQYQDLESFFKEEREENLNLEFKSFIDKGSIKDKEKVIYKSICALLNSEGGVIIWGAPTEIRDDDGITKASGSLTPFNIGLDKDKFINKISSNLIPMPINIKVNFLENDENKSIIIIEVPKSIERPHQYDNKYFVRLDGQTRIAPHYLIKALFKSKDFPILRGHIKLKSINTDRYNLRLTFRKLIYNTSKFNNEINPFYKVIVHPGTIFHNHINKGNEIDGEFPILSYGRPEMFDFQVLINFQYIKEDINIIFQFGGEKSPSKMSDYTYNFSSSLDIGNNIDENKYLKNKNENKSSSEINDSSDDDKINSILNM